MEGKDQEQTNRGCRSVAKQTERKISRGCRINNEWSYASKAFKSKREENYGATSPHHENLSVSFADSSHGRHSRELKKSQNCGTAVPPASLSEGDVTK